MVMEGFLVDSIVTGSMTAVDPRFVAALKPGGRLFVVVGDSPAMIAMLVERSEGGEITTNELFETDIPALVAPSRPPEFSF